MSIYAHFRSRVRVILIVIAYVLASLLGIYLAATAGNSYYQMVRSAVYTVSDRSLILLNVLPFLFSILLLHYRKHGFVFLISLIKCACYFMCASSVASLYRGAGWLIQALLLFSDIFLLPLLILISVRASRGRTPPIVQQLFVCLWATVVGFIDVYFVSPYLVKLIET